MTTQTLPVASLNVAQVSEQRATPGRFQEALKSAAFSMLSGVAAGLGATAPLVPAGTVLSAVVRGASSAATRSTGTAGTSGNDLLSATKALQEQSQSFNLQYLQLQEGMQRENREFTTLSNVMRVKHDSAKSAIQNIH